MGNRAYLSVIMADGSEIELFEKKDIIPDEWLRLVSTDEYRQDTKYENCINPRFEVTAENARNRLSFFFGNGNAFANSIREILSDDDILVLTCSEVIDNPDLYDVPSKEEYFEKIRKFQGAFQACDFQ